MRSTNRLPLIIRLSWYSVHLACCWNMLGRIILMGWNNTHTHICICYIYIYVCVCVILYHIIIINYLSIIYIYIYIWRYIHTWAIDSIFLFSVFQLRIHISQVRQLQGTKARRRMGNCQRRLRKSMISLSAQGRPTDDLRPSHQGGPTEKWPWRRAGAVIRYSSHFMPHLSHALAIPL